MAVGRAPGTGAGPGESSAADRFAPDGSPVPFYERMPPRGEPELIHAAIPAGAEILELGAGAGRITHPLLRLGHPVVAVDQSRAMLDRIRDVETVEGDIEALALDRRFCVVLLPSNFINDPDRGRRLAFLACCARHVLPSGQVLLEGFPREWSPSSDWSEHGGVRLRLASFARKGSLVSGEMEYLVDGERLTHRFESRLLSEDELDDDLASAGLRRVRYLDDAGAWVEARLAS
jgi:SAM-dependent methyltransferase